MPKSQNLAKFSIAFAILCFIMGGSTILLLQQMNGKIYEYTSDHGSQGKRFQDAMGKLSSPLLLFGLGLLGGSAVLAVLGVQGLANKIERIDSSKDLSELASLLDSSQNMAALSPAAPTQTQPGELMQRLRDSISRLNLEITEARKRERAVIERAVDVICITDIESRFVSVSKACISAWGYTPQELEKRSLMDIIVSDDANNILNSILGSAKSIDKIVFECKLRKKTGELMDVVWTGHWSASDGGLFCIVHDITERKRAEELVKESEAQLRLILEGLPAGVMIVNRSNAVEFANSAASHMLLADKEQIKGKKAESLINEKHAIDSSTQDGSENQRVLATAHRLDGSQFPVDFSESKIDLAGQEKNIFVFLDKTKEQELEQMKREFIAMVTHDIRTPLGSVVGILTLLEEGIIGQLTEQGERTIGRVRATCNRLLRLINDMLDLEKIHAGKFSLELKEMSIKHAVEQAIENMLPLAEAKKLEFVIDVPETNCWADEDRVVQVLVNLISNAIKYSDENQKLTVNAIEFHSNATEFIKVFVCDQGRGIPADKLSKVFSQFEQVEISDAKKKGGTGLGLAICQAIVHEHKGEIGVESVLGEGSSFWFTLPKHDLSVE